MFNAGFHSHGNGYNDMALLLRLAKNRFETSWPMYFYNITYTVLSRGITISHFTTTQILEKIGAVSINNNESLYMRGKRVLRLRPNNTTQNDKIIEMTINYHSCVAKRSMPHWISGYIHLPSMKTTRNHTQKMHTSRRKPLGGLHVCAKEDKWNHLWHL